MEEGIDRLVAQLDEEGLLDESVPICIDGSIRNWHKHPNGADQRPDGVYREEYFETDYGWKDISANAIINGRSVVLANVSMVPGDKTFKAVKYLINRCRDLVDIECVYADAAFATTQITRYINHIGEDYVIKKPHTSAVQDELEEFTGRADWTEYTMRTGTGAQRGIRESSTTLFGVEKRGQIGVKRGETMHDEHSQSGLDDFDVQSEGQTTLEDHKPAEDIEYAAFITNKEIESVGIDPDENPVAHSPENTVWGVAEGYRQRWSIETAFRQVKYQFLARTTSRDLGVRRFYWMLAMMLYDSWAVMNLLVQEWSDDYREDRPPVRAKVFLEALARRDQPPPD
nr:transposase [Halobacterium noricense]